MNWPNLVKVLRRGPHFSPGLEQMLNGDGEEDVQGTLLREEHLLQVDVDRLEIVLTDVQRFDDQLEHKIREQS